MITIRAMIHLTLCATFSLGAKAGRGGTSNVSSAFLAVCPDSTLDVIFISEKNTDQRMSTDEQGKLPMKAPLQRAVFSMIRFEMLCTDLNYYTS